MVKGRGRISLIAHKEKPFKEIAKGIGRNIQAIKNKRTLLRLKRNQKLDLQGKRYGRFIVLQEVVRKRRNTTWLCKCDCGPEKILLGTNLENRIQFEY